MRMHRTARRLGILTRLLLALALALAGTAAAQEQSLAPGINRHYEDADPQYWRRTFEREGREVYDRRSEILAAVGVQPGMSVADVGAGTGLFTLAFAEAAGPAGRVYAVDIAEGFVRGIEARAAAAGLGNVVGIVGEARSARLPADSVDLVLLCDTYHHFEYPQDMLASLKAALRPGGTLVVIDFRKDPAVSSAWVMGHVRADEATVIAEIEAAGFSLLARPELLRDHYFLRFQRP